MFRLLETFTVEKLMKWFWGDFDGLLLVLIVFVIVEFITTILLAISKCKVSSSLGVQGFMRRVVLFLLVGIGHIIDAHLAGGGEAFRTITIWFYIAYEGKTILENSEKLGLPVPKKLMEFFKKTANPG